MSKPENPPAFPQPGFPREPGMTLRDWFAGQALTGLVSGHLAASPDHNIGSEDGPHLATESYRIADAMLSARGDA